MPPIQTRPPRMLKEFLRDDDVAGNHRQPPLPRSRSRSRAAISSFHKLLQKSLHLVSLSSPSPAPENLPRTLSKRLLMIGFRWPAKNPSPREMNGKVKLKVKDILRWRSFRDSPEIEDHPQPLDSAGPTSSGSEGLRWGDEYDELQCGWDHCKMWDQGVKMDGGDLVAGTNEASDSARVGPQDHVASEDEKEQHSPVSILDSPFRDETLEPELVISSFNESLANMERTKQRLMQSIQWFESLAGLDDKLSQEEEEEEDDDDDTETEELLEEEYRKEGNELINEECKSRVYLSKGLCWLKSRKQGLKDKEECIKDMERQSQWDNKFGEEREELVVELEVELLHDLVGDVLIDLFGHGRNRNMII